MPYIRLKTYRLTILPIGLDSKARGKGEKPPQRPKIALNSGSTVTAVRNPAAVYQAAEELRQPRLCGAYSGEDARNSNAKRLRHECEIDTCRLVQAMAHRCCCRGRSHHLRLDRSADLDSCGAFSGLFRNLSNLSRLARSHRVERRANARHHKNAINTSEGASTSNAPSRKVVIPALAIKTSLCPPGEHLALIIVTLIGPNRTLIGPRAAGQRIGCSKRSYTQLEIV